MSFARSEGGIFPNLPQSRSVALVDQIERFYTRNLPLRGARIAVEH